LLILADMFITKYFRSLIVNLIDFFSPFIAERNYTIHSSIYNPFKRAIIILFFSMAVIIY